MAPQPVCRHGGILHRLHRLHAGDALSAALHPSARGHRGRRDRALDGGDPGGHAGVDGAAVVDWRRQHRRHGVDGADGDGGRGPLPHFAVPHGHHDCQRRQRRFAVAGHTDRRGGQRHRAEDRARRRPVQRLREQSDRACSDRHRRLSAVWRLASLRASRRRSGPLHGPVVGSDGAGARPIRGITLVALPLVSAGSV